jgi:hypothetical protein
MSKAGLRGAGMIVVHDVQCAEPAKLEQIIQDNLRGLEYGG